jgi:hypothetical protein
VIIPAAGICLEACFALHYAAVQRADEKRDRRDMRKTAQITLRMSETQETASADGRTLPARTVRRRVGDPMGPVLFFRRAARRPPATRKAQ